MLTCNLLGQVAAWYVWLAGPWISLLSYEQDSMHFVGRQLNACKVMFDGEQESCFEYDVYWLFDYMVEAVFHLAALCTVPAFCVAM